MDVIRIIKRAWSILWSYKTLWIFGILIALVGGSNIGPRGNNNVQYNIGSQDFQNGRHFFTPPPEVQQGLERILQQLNRVFLPEVWPTVLAIIIVLAILLLALIVINRIVYYVSRGAQIRMVNQYEATGEKVRFRQGWRMGWSRSAWRMFLIDVIVFIPAFLVFIALFGCAALPVITSIISGNQPGAFSIVSTIGLFFLALFLFLILALVLSMLMELIYRACVLENKGVFESIREGWALVRKNLKDVFLLWLLIVGIRIAYVILMIPVVILLIAVGLMFGGGLGAGLYFLLHALSATTFASAMWGIGVGIFLLILVLALPLLFLGGLYHTFTSNAWTLAYRELTLPKLPEEPAGGEMQAA